MAYRIGAYQGVMMLRGHAAREAQPEPAAPAVAPAPSRQRADWALRHQQRDSAGRDIIPATKDAIRSHPELAAVFEFG
jgi:hypothetical protein